MSRDDTGKLRIAFRDFRTCSAVGSLATDDQNSLRAWGTDRKNGRINFCALNRWELVPSCSSPGSEPEHLDNTYIMYDENSQVKSFLGRIRMVNRLKE